MTIAERWPADKFERRPVAELVPAARNARTHSDEQVAQIAASIKEFGWTVPVLIDEAGNLIAGHGRVLAARQLGLIDIPVMIARGWSEAKIRAYAIADNKLPMNADWDLDALKIELAELREADFDIDLTGFSLDELDDLFNEEQPSAGNGSLADQFMIAPFSVLNAREGWWQNRKRLWIGLGIQSELGRGASGALNTPAAAKLPSKAIDIVTKRRKSDAAPGGSKRPASDYSPARGDGRGRPV